jgi:hypothetical protein
MVRDRNGWIVGLAEGHSLCSHEPVPDSALPLAPTMYRPNPLQWRTITKSISCQPHWSNPYSCRSLLLLCLWSLACTANNAGFTMCDATHPCFGNPRHTPALLPCHTDRCWGVYATDLVLPADRRCIIRCWSLQITNLLLCLPRHSWKVSTSTDDTMA